MTGPESAHVDWTNPYYRGPVKALFIVPMRMARQVVELQERLDIKYDYVYVQGNKFPEPGSTPLVIDIPGVENKEKEIDRLKRYLTENRYDVMVLTSLSDSTYVGSQPPIKLAENVEALIIDRVKEGMGLVYFCAGATPASWRNVLPLIVESGGAMPPMPDTAALLASREIRTGADSESLQLKRHYISSAIPSISFRFPMAFYTAVKVTGSEIINYDKTAVAAVGTFGKGRVVAFSVGNDFVEFKDFRKFPPVRNDEYLEYPYHEYGYLLLSRAMLWAAGREPEIRINRITGPEGVQTGDEGVLEIEVENGAGQPGIFSLEATIRDKFYEIVIYKKTEVQAGASGEASVRFPLGKLPGEGRYTAEVILKERNGAVLDSGAGEFTVKSDKVIGKIEIDRKICNPGEPVKGVIVVNAGKAERAEISLCVFDTHKRIIRKQVQEADLARGENKIPFEMKGISTCSQILHLECTLRDSDAFVLDRRIAYIYMKQPLDVSEILVRTCSLSSSMPSSSVSDVLIQAMKEYGVEGSGMEIRNYQPFVAMNNDFRRGDIAYMVGPYAGVMGDQTIPSRKGDPVDWEEAKVDDVYNVAAPYGRPENCINHPAFTEGITRQVRSVLEGQAPFGYDFLSVADENVFQRWIYDKASPKDDICFCRYTVKAFQDYLKNEYGSLGALNKSWEKDFKKWEDVVPDTARHARYGENIAPWLDFRIFLAKCYANVFVNAQKTAGEVYPGIKFAANVHWEGPYTCFMPYYLFSKSRLRACMFYPRTFDQVRSHAYNSKYRQIYVGYDAWGHEKDWSDYYAWKNLGYGSGLTGIYNGLDFAYWGSVLTPSYGPGSLSKWTGDYYRYMKQGGMAKTILTAEQKKSEVAVLDSYPSQFARYLEAKLFDEKGFYKKNTYSMWSEYKRYWSSYGTLCEDLGLGWRLVSNEGLKEGSLDRYRIIILPRVTCISDSTLKNLKEFAEKGGMVIADYRLAVYDEHGSPQKSRLLEELFGVKREKAEWDESPEELSVDNKKVFEFKGTIRGMEREKRIVITGDADVAGRYTDGTPAVIVRRVGRGYAVYLNFTIDNYSSKMGDVRSLFDSLFSAAGVKSDPSMENAAGQKVPGIFVNSFRRGNLQYVFLLGDGGSQEVYLRTDRKYHVYEIPGNRYVGYEEKFQIKPMKSRGTLYALLPYEVQYLNINLKKDDVKAGEEVTMEVTIIPAGRQTPGDHVIRIEARSPDGKECAWWTKNVVTENGRYVEKLEPALNEQTGSWQVKVTDTVSGKCAEKRFTVREK